jgi:hypothetical protein
VDGESEPVPLVRPDAGSEVILAKFVLRDSGLKSTRRLDGYGELSHGGWGDRLVQGCFLQLFQGLPCLVLPLGAAIGRATKHDAGRG